MLEIVHSLVGLVKSPWVTTFLQGIHIFLVSILAINTFLTVFSRVWTLWAVMDVAPTAQSSIFTVLACTSWGLVEVPRYLFYALNLLDAVPYPLFWLRYRLRGFPSAEMLCKVIFHISAACLLCCIQRASPASWAACTRLLCTF